MKVHSRHERPGTLRSHLLPRDLQSPSRSRERIAEMYRTKWPGRPVATAKPGIDVFNQVTFSDRDHCADAGKIHLTCMEA